MTRPTSVNGRSRARLIALCLALLTLAWIVTPAMSSPPLYDGLGFPDEPYRYVAPPPGYRHTAPPSVGEDDGMFYKGVGPQVLLPVSDENGPQVQAGIPATQLEIPAGTTQLVAKATPLAPTGAAPADGTVWGNVYRLTVTGDHGPVTATDHTTSDSVVSLRAPSAQQPPPVMEYRPVGSGGGDGAGAWRDLHTTRIGNDIYQAPLPGLGDYALVRLAPGAARPQSTGGAPAASAASRTPGSASALPWVLGGAFALLCAAILAVRVRRTRSGESGSGSRGA